MKLGDHLVVSRGLYSHHGIYLGDCQVIHYAGLAGGMSASDGLSAICITGLNEFTAGRAIHIRRHASPFCREQVVQRALSRLGEDRYHVLWRNCEHFATWCWTNHSHSPQVVRAGRLLIQLFEELPAVIRTLRSTTNPPRSRKSVWL